MEFSIEEFNSPSKSFNYNYKKLCLIGNGAYGKVYKAKDLKTNNIVAVKKIKINNLNINYEYVLKEINILKNLSHQNIVKYYNYYEEHDNIYIIMEYLEGGTIKDFIKNEKNKITEDICRIIINQILSALSHLHYICDICHRDIKPENIMFKYKDNIKSLKLIDFGLSSNSFEKKNYLENCGTLIYMAPEQISNKIYNKSVDIWSVGIILYMLLNNGNNPFYIKGDSREKVISKITSKKVEYDDNNYPISEMGKSFINKLLMKNSSNRYTARPALNHPWVTMQKYEKIPMNVLDKLLIVDYINKIKELFLTALFMNYYKNNNLKINIKNTSNDNFIEESLRKTFSMTSNGTKIKRNNINYDINNKNIKVFNLDEYFQRVKSSNILLEKKFKQNRERMFITKKINNEIKNINEEEKSSNNYNSIFRHIKDNEKTKNDKIVVLDYLHKNYKINNFKSSSNLNINENKLSKINNQKKNNIINDKKSSNKMFQSIDLLIKKAKINHIDNTKDNDNFSNNEMITLQKFLNKEKTINKLNQLNGFFITGNQHNSSINNKSILKYKYKLSNNSSNYRNSCHKSKNKKIKLVKKNSCVLIKHHQNTSCLENYYNNKIYIKNRPKNKSNDNINVLFLKNNSLRKNIKKLETKTNINNKYDFYIPSENINKNMSCISLGKNKINDVTYNVQKPKKLLFDIKRKILPKLI